MQFKLTFSLDTPLRLPLSHHHIVQGFLYHILEQHPDYSEFLHNIGHQSSDRKTYKLFSFGLLQGHYNVQKPFIIFSDTILLEVRSPAPLFCKVFAEALQTQTSFYLNAQKINLVQVSQSDVTICQSEIRIKMISPICLHKTILGSKENKTHYFSPYDTDFHQAFLANYQRKYQAAYGTPSLDVVSLTAHKVSERDKYVTKFKDIYITAWKGIYILNGTPEALTFLYYAGLGARNSQGFGLFELL